MDADTNHLILARRGGFFDEAIPIQEPTARTGKSTNCRQHGLGVGDDGDPMYTLQAGKQHGVAVAFDAMNQQHSDVAHTLRAGDGAGHESMPIAFSCKDAGLDAGPISPTLRACGHTTSHANGGGQVAVAFHPTQDPISSEEISHALGCGSAVGRLLGRLLGRRRSQWPFTKISARRSH